MGFHVDYTPPYDEDFDLAFVQQFWRVDGVSSGESVTAASAGFGGPHPLHIRIRFKYTISGATTVHSDSVAVLCS